MNIAIKQLILFSILILTACGYGRQVPMDVYVTQDSNRLWLSEDDSLGHSHDDNVYIIGIHDVLHITVRDHSEFDGILPVNEKGDIRMRLLEEPLHVEGLSLKEAEEVIGHFIRPYTKNRPLIHVDLKSSGSRFFYVVGSKVGDGNQISKISLGVKPVYLREMLFGTEADVRLDEIKIVKPDFTDENNPLFTTIDMTGVSKGHWGIDYRVRPNDMIVFQQKFYVKLQGVLEMFSESAKAVEKTDGDMFEALAYLDDRLRNSRHFRFEGPKVAEE